jgi:hypothetical protein
MSERDQDRDRKLGPNELEPGEEEFDDELEGGDEEAPEEFEAESHEVEPSHRRFGLGRHEEAETGHHAGGSRRESHERVRIDDRMSAAYVIIAAGVLLGALALAVAGNWIPQPTVPTLAPLVVPTVQAAPSASPAATVAPTAAPAAS